MKKLICLCLTASIFAASCVSAVMAANGNESDIEAAVETAEPIVTSTPDAGGNGTDVGNSVGSEAAVGAADAGDGTETGDSVGSEAAVGTADAGGVTDMGNNGENAPVNEQAAQNTGIEYDNPILTPEEEERARAYEERLLREMEDEEVAGKVTLASANMPSYEQYLADWVYSDGEGHGYNLYTKSFSTPYRSYVETHRGDAAFEALLAAWRIATFELSDVTSYSAKEIGFYETILFDLLYQGEATTSLAGSLNKGVKTLQSSAVKNMAELQNKTTEAFINQNIADMGSEELNALLETMDQCEQFATVFDAIGDVSKILSYADTVEELVYKIAKAQVISKNNDDTAKVLIKMKSMTSDPKMQLALTNMIAICSENASAESITTMLVANAGVETLLNTLLEKTWDGVIKHLNVAGIAVSAGQAVGKMLTNFLFSTEEEVEMYYEFCALYDFENTLKSALSSFESSYRSTSSHDNASVFMQAYKMLLQTHLLGIKASQRYLDQLYVNGAINQLLLWFREDEYEGYKTQLANLKLGVEDVISFLETTAYNLYVDEYKITYGEDMYLEKEEVKYTAQEQETIMNSTQTTSLTLGNITITDGMTLTDDLTTYGSVYLQEGILDVNGHTLDISGDLIIAEIGSKTENGVTTPEYYHADAALKMTEPNDYVMIGGNFITYGESTYDTSYVGNSILNAGTMEIGGNFEQYGYNDEFYTGGTHTVIFNGSGEQSIYFNGPSYSGFTNVEFKNPNINFTSGIKGFTLQNDINLMNETLNIYGEIDMNGHTVSRHGNLYQTDGTLAINGGSLNVSGDYAIADVSYVTDEGITTPSFSKSSALLQMTNTADRVQVVGDFITYGDSTWDSSYTDNSILNAGTMEIGGNFEQYYNGAAYNFYTGGTHTVIFNGSGEQNIYFSHPSYSGFTNVEFKNPNINFTSGITGFKLTNDATISNDTELEIYGTLDLNGRALNINGNLYQTSGTLAINGGSLNVSGDYAIADVSYETDEGITTPSFSSSSALLQMTNTADRVKVGGNFITYGDSTQDSSYTDNSILNAGTMKIGGNFEQYGYDDEFYTGGTHTVIFNGSGEQSIYFSGPSSSHFANLQIANKTGAIRFTSDAAVLYTLTQPGGAEIGGSENVTLQDKPAFEDRGADNGAINTYVGNAEGVIPTWMDCEAYDNREEPVGYMINELSVSGGNVVINITRGQGEAGVAVAAAYAEDGTLIDFAFDDIETAEETFDITLSLNTDGAERITAFVWNSMDTMVPISAAKEI